MRIFTWIILALLLVFVFLQFSGIELKPTGEQKIVEEKTVVIETYDEKGNIVETGVAENGNG